MVTVAPPVGPTDNGLMDYDGACNDICPSGFEDGSAPLKLTYRARV